jgi:hypothetical protein
MPEHNGRAGGAWLGGVRASEGAEGGGTARRANPSHRPALAQRAHHGRLLAAATLRANEAQAARARVGGGGGARTSIRPRLLARSAPAPLRAVRRRAEPEGAAPLRRHTQARAAPFTSRADYQEPERSAPARVQGNSDTRMAPTPLRPAKASQGAMSPAAAASSPTPPGASVPGAAQQRAPREPVHKRQPLARVCARAAQRRATPRRARKCRAEPQAHPGTRHTFHEPRGLPGAGAERARARDVAHIALCFTQNRYRVFALYRPKIA